MKYEIFETENGQVVRVMDSRGVEVFETAPALSVEAVKAEISDAWLDGEIGPMEADLLFSAAEDLEDWPEPSRW